MIRAYGGDDHYDRRRDPVVITSSGRRSRDIAKDPNPINVANPQRWNGKKSR